MKLAKALINITTLAACCAALVGCSDEGPMAPEPTPMRIISTFSNGMQGWTALGDYTGLRTDGILRPGTRGVYGNFLRAHDKAEGETWYYKASRNYHGDLEAFYGGRLSYWLRIGKGVNPLQGFENGEYFSDYDVILRGGGLTMGYVIPQVNLPKSSEWSLVDVALSTDVGWTVFNGRARRRATEEQIRTVLSDVIDLRIRGEYFVGVDWSAIDEVTLRTP